MQWYHNIFDLMTSTETSRDIDRDIASKNSLEFRPIEATNFHQINLITITLTTP